MVIYIYLSEVVEKPVTEAHVLGREVSGAFGRIDVDFLRKVVGRSRRERTGPARPGIVVGVGCRRRRRRGRRATSSEKRQRATRTSGGGEREAAERESEEEVWVADKEGRICRHGCGRRKNGWNRYG